MVGLNEVIIFSVGVILGGVVLYFIQKYRTRKRIIEVESLIVELKNNNLRTPMKEDDFSKLEDEIYKVFVELVEGKEVVSRVLNEQSQNLEDIAHQIKTPITSMLFETELLQDKGINVDILNHQIKRLHKLTDILLKLSSIEVNKNKMKLKNENISEIIENAIETLSGDIKSNNVSIVNDVKDMIVEVDFYWMSEAIINILKNAIIRSKNKNIYIKSNENPIYFEITIEDEASGIKKENLKNIFKRFYKTPDSDGFGIGLTIAKTIIENNHGSISVENINLGARFSIKIYK